MQAASAQQDLIVWADPGMLAEAQTVFSPYDAPIKAIPNTCNAKDLSPASFADIRKRLGLTQEQFAQSLRVAPRTVQNWESGFGTSQMPKRTKDVRQLLSLMDEYVLAPHEQEWLNTPLPAIQGLTPQQAIQQGRTRDLVIEFLRLAEGQPV